MSETAEKRASAAARGRLHTDRLGMSRSPHPAWPWHPRPDMTTEEPRQSDERAEAGRRVLRLDGSKRGDERKIARPASRLAGGGQILRDVFFPGAFPAAPQRRVGTGGCVGVHGAYEGHTVQYLLVTGATEPERAYGREALQGSTIS